MLVLISILQTFFNSNLFSSFQPVIHPQATNNHQKRILIMATYKFRCPSCKKVIAELNGGNCSIMGDATICSDFPPQNYNSNWIKCTKDNQYAVIEGHAAKANNTTKVQYTTTTTTQTVYTVKKKKQGFTFGPVGVKFHF